MSVDNSVPDLPTKQCSKCRQYSPATLEYFYADRRRPFGLCSACKICVKAVRKPCTPARKVSKTAWYLANRLQCDASARKWCIDHPEEARASGRRRSARYRATHPEVTHIQNVKYHAEDPGRSCIRSATRRARKANATINDFTHAQWLEIQAAYDHRCVYCGKRAKGKLTQDHIQPLSKGGNHTASNIVPACSICNSKKYNGPPKVPIQPLLLTIAKPRKAG